MICIAYQCLKVWAGRGGGGREGALKCNFLICADVIHAVKSKQFNVRKMQQKKHGSLHCQPSQYPSVSDL